MLFSSTVFTFAFLGLLIPLYYLLKRFTLAKNLLLFFASLVFFSWGEPKYLPLFLLSIVGNHIFGLLCGHYKEKNKKTARFWLIMMVVFNLTILFIFKYLTFFLSNVKMITALQFNLPIIELPLGVSFFTFQSMSYVIDVYRGDGKMQKNIFYTGLYIAAFPQLVAGPIVRYQTVADEIVGRKENLVDFSEGFCRFAAGVIKKVMLSNQMALIADAAYSANTSGALSAPLAWLGALAYMFQIYYDFSGYSDMAIGLGRIFGFHYDENFNFPYTSKSVSEFWRRWHISLGTWFRMYVYIPLGGSRVSKGRLVFNLFCVWMLTGIWHGAEWTFFLWGLYYFLFLAAEKLFPAFFERIPTALRLIGTQIAVYFGWILFRAEDLPRFLSSIGSMFSAPNFADPTFLRFVTTKWVFLAAAFVFSFPICRWVNRKLSTLHAAESRGMRTVAGIGSALYPVIYMTLFFISIAYLLKGSYNPFIYFNF